MKTNYLIIGGVAISASVIIYLISQADKSKKVTALDHQPSGDGQKATTLFLPNWNQPFNQEFADEVKKYLAPKKVVELDPVLGKKLSKTLLNAKGFFLDDEDDVEEIFTKRLKTKVHLSNLSKAFYQETGGKDLWQYLDSFISRTKINRWVSQLSNYQIQP
ncbi:MAG: hypothetical protein AAFO69_12400 [Bacteroidota bacterium]